MRLLMLNATWVTFMDCQTFLARYTEYRDGSDTALLAAMTAHMRACPGCARHDRALRVGVEALRSGEISPSAEFRRSLELRLEEEAARQYRSTPQTSR